MARPLRNSQPEFAFRLEELARNVGDLRREVRSLPQGSATGGNPPDGDYGDITILGREWIVEDIDGGTFN